MDTKKIEKLILLLKKHGLHEIEIEEENIGKVRITGSSGFLSSTAYPSSYAGGLNQPSFSQNEGTLTQGGSVADSGLAVSRDKQIRSPFVGTYYEAASPGAEPFVRVGQKIRKGDTLCIIEAMKIMNEIESERDGTIREILVKNGQALEFDQIIFVVE